MTRSRAAPVWRAAVFVAAAAALAGAEAAAQSKPAKVEWVTIDGAKNPELIPEWSAWEDVFKTIGDGRRRLPSNVHYVTSDQEAALIFREAEASVKRTAQYKERLLNLHTEMPGSTPLQRLAKQKEIRLECRWANLHARDRLLAALSPSAAGALTVFAEAQKKGTSFTVAKSEVAFLRLPQ